MVWSSEKLRWMLQFGLCVMSLGCVSSVSGSFSFEIHHRFSEQVKTVLGGHGLPEMGTLEYYNALVHRDRRRRLTSNNNQTTVSFSQGNSTHEIRFLHYANVTVGTPAQWFLVALDTGSHLFWLPCNCKSNCVRSMETDDGEIKLNIYDPSISTSSSKVLCNSTICSSSDRCFSPQDDCPYMIRYLSPGSRSTGVLVEDVLHLRTEEGEAKDPRITFGCSESQVGLFTEVAANGIMGLAIADIAVPNMLAKTGVAADSFSMCFGENGKGTISFGDKGHSDQLETPLTLTPSLPFYNVSMTKLKVGTVTVETEFSAVFDSGTAVTWLLEPYYTSLTTNYHLHVTDERLPASVKSPFEFCYIVTSSSDEETLPLVSFETKGGAVYKVFNPILVFLTNNGREIYCLAVLKQDKADFNIIGQNFMTNYRIVHDRERMILGWTESDCNDENRSTETTASAKPPSSLPPRPSPRTTNPSTRLNPMAFSSLFIFCFISFVYL